jgi:formate hydrogenlyase subunit 3/multisubunit Na+/H+ antiporter MnhD subunit
MTRNLRIEAAVGPATREQLERWADQHDRTWDRIVRAGVVIFGLGLLGLAGLATTEGFQAFKGVRSSLITGNPALSDLWWLGLLGQMVSLACALVIAWLWWHFVLRRNFRPINPYRPIDVKVDELERANAKYPGALAYLDAVRHQQRPIVQHDIDVLATIRGQQRFTQGADR